jgi:hypothetical protein
MLEILRNETFVPWNPTEGNDLIVGDFVRTKNNLKDIGKCIEVKKTGEKNYECVCTPIHCIFLTHERNPSACYPCDNPFKNKCDYYNKLT